MLADIYYSIINTLLRIGVSLQPHWNLPDAIYSTVAQTVQYLGKLNHYLPLDTLFTAVGVFVGFVTVYYAGKVGLSFINWLRGSGEIKI